MYEAAEVFIKLSVGESLIIQIYALIASPAIGLLVSKGSTRGASRLDVSTSLTPIRVLSVAVGPLMTLALMPGLQMLHFITLTSCIATIFYVIPMQHNRYMAEAEKQTDEAENVE